MSASPHSSRPESSLRASPSSLTGPFRPRNPVPGPPSNPSKCCFASATPKIPNQPSAYFPADFGFRTDSVSSPLSYVGKLTFRAHRQVPQSVNRSLHPSDKKSPEKKLGPKPIRINSGLKIGKDDQRSSPAPRKRSQPLSSGKKKRKQSRDLDKQTHPPLTPKMSPKAGQKTARHSERGLVRTQGPNSEDPLTATPVLSHWGTLKKIAVPPHLLSRTHNIASTPPASSPRNANEFWVSGTISLQRIQKSLEDYNTNLRRFQHTQEFERLRSSIDNYKIIRVLGRHDGWEKLLALHRLSDDLVIIIREKAKPGSEELADRVLFLKQISQFPVAMPIFELFHDGADLCIVTLYCPNGNVSTFFQQQKASLSAIKTFIVKLMRGLQRLYECGVVPLDLSWSRVMVDPRGEPRISNFCFRKIDPNPVETFKFNTRILSSFLIQRLQDPRALLGLGLPNEASTLKQNMGLNTRRIGDLLRNLMQERFFMTALAAEQVRFEHDMTPLEITEYNEAIFKGFLKVFYRRHIDLSSAIRTAVNHSFLREAAAHPDSQWTERNPAHEAALLTFYENFLAAKGVLPEFTRFCVAAKRNNPVKSGFRALLAKGGPK